MNGQSLLATLRRIKYGELLNKLNAMPKGLTIEGEYYEKDKADQASRRIEIPKV